MARNHLKMAMELSLKQSSVEMHQLKERQVHYHNVGGALWSFIHNLGDYL